MFAFGRRPNAMSRPHSRGTKSSVRVSAVNSCELDVVYERLAKFPILYAELYRGLRRARLRRFPVGVFYLVTPAEIHIVAVVHAARSPNVWRSR
jgi:plasmid stabilization system protein ParE